MAVLDEYVWLVVVGAFVAFGFGWGTGELYLHDCARLQMQQRWYLHAL